MAQSAPARVSLGTLVSSTARETMWSRALRTRADSRMYMLVASLAVVAMSPCARRTPACSSTASSVASPCRASQPWSSARRQLLGGLPPHAAQAGHDGVSAELVDVFLHLASPRGIRQSYGDEIVHDHTESI